MAGGIRFIRSISNFGRLTLRVALLTIADAVELGGTPRAFLRIGGISLARQQLALLLALGCERVACISHSNDPQLAELRDVAEKGGAQLHLIPGPRALAGLVTAADDLLVLNEGLLVEPESAVQLLDPGPAVLVQPIEQGLAAGFERIDINHAAAGAMRIPGRLVERLAELPPDCDAASALLRIALQAGVAQRMLPAAARDGAHWILIRDEAEAQRAEGNWFQKNTVLERWTSPGVAVAQIAVRALGPAVLHAGSGGNVVALASATVALLALGAAWFGFAATALIVLAISWILRTAGGSLLRIEQGSLLLPHERVPREAIFGWLFDIVLVVVLLWSAPPFPWQSLLDRAFPPVILLCLARLLPRVIDRYWVSWTNDRALLAIVLALAAMTGQLDEAVCVLALTLAFMALVLPKVVTGLTRA